MQYSYPVNALAAHTTSDHAAGAGTRYGVETPSGVQYLVFIDSGADVYFKKSTDGGKTWGAAVVLFTGSAVSLSIWYDRDSGIAAGLIHCAYTESVGNDVLYRTIDTENSDALSTQTTIFAGASVASGKMLSITRARGGNVYCRVCIDAGAEGGFFRLPNANVPNGAWDAARTINEALATQDQMILAPGFAADDQDIIGIFWDASVNEISRQLYDDSANSWAETSIATSMTDSVATSHFPHFAIAVDLTNSQILLVAWSQVDAVNADLRCWKITESAITEMTNIVLNSGDDQGLAAIGIDTVTGYWYVFYFGKSDGSDTFNTSGRIYCKVSKDGGSTWGGEFPVSGSAANGASVSQSNISLSCCQRFVRSPCITLVLGNVGTQIVICVDTVSPRASFQLGA